MAIRSSILADIGGTNARFAILNEAGSIDRVKIYQVRENPTLIGALLDYAATECYDVSIQSVAMAVAGPVLGDIVPLTNSDWVCNSNEIRQALSLEHVDILNDFEAVAVAVTHLDPSDISVIQAGDFSARHPRIIMGPGTGLGIAGLKPVKSGGHEAVTTEAGHTRYAPANERERNIVKILSRGLGFVSAENLVSGPGLVHLYQANCELVGETAKPCIPADVVGWARTGDKLCSQVLDDFCAIFGSVASQMALSYISLGGVYLTGGVLQKMGNDFNQKRFLERFLTNPRMSDLLGKMPVYRVMADIPAFAGLKVVAKKNFD